MIGLHLCHFTTFNLPDNIINDEALAKNPNLPEKVVTDTCFLLYLTIKKNSTLLHLVNILNPTKIL